MITWRDESSGKTGFQCCAVGGYIYKIVLIFGYIFKTDFVAFQCYAKTTLTLQRFIKIDRVKFENDLFAEKHVEIGIPYLYVEFKGSYGTFLTSFASGFVSFSL